MKTKAERLQQVFDYLVFMGLLKRRYEFAEQINFDKTNLSSALNGNEKYLSDSLFDKILETYPFFNRDWLFHGIGEMLKTENNPNTLSNVTNSGNIMMASNVFGNTTQISGGMDTQTEEETTEAIPYVDTDVVRKRNFNLRSAIKNNDVEQKKTFDDLFGSVDYIQKIITDAMYPLFQQGDYVFIKFLPDNASLISGAIYLIDSKSYGTLIRQVYVNENGYTLHSINPNYEELSISNDDVFSFGLVVHSLRSTFNMPPNFSTLDHIAKKSSDQIDKLIDEVQKQNDRFENERNKRDELLNYILRKTNQ